METSENAPPRINNIFEAFFIKTPFPQIIEELDMVRFYTNCLTLSIFIDFKENALSLFLKKVYTIEDIFERF